MKIVINIIICSLFGNSLCIIIIEKLCSYRAQNLVQDVGFL